MAPAWRVASRDSVPAVLPGPSTPCADPGRVGQQRIDKRPLRVTGVRGIWVAPWSPGICWRPGTLGEAESYPGQHAERTGKLHAGDGAGTDHRDSDQRRNGDQSVEQPGPFRAQACYRREPGDEHDRGDRHRQVQQSGQFGSGERAQNRRAAGQANQDRRGEQLGGGQPARVNRDSQRTEPGQQRRGQQ